jgi:toxin ParE1/3/4
MPVAFAPAAARDIEEIGDYIHAENPPAAARFTATLRARCLRIADAPRGDAPRPALWPALRSVPFRRYVIFYTLDGNNVRIERVLHGARDIEAVFDADGD